MRGCPAVSDKVSDAGDERAKREVNIANDVKWKPVIPEDNREERKVREELKEVCIASTSEQPIRGSGQLGPSHL